MKKFIIVCLYSLLVMTDSSYAKQTQLLSVNYGKIVGKQVNIDFFLSKSVEYKYFILSDPSRLVIDFKNAFLDKNTLLSFSPHPYIDRIRSAARKTNDFRIVFDFKPGVFPVKFKLSKDDNDKKHLRLNVLVNQDLVSQKPKNGVPPPVSINSKKSNSNVLQTNASVTTSRKNSIVTEQNFFSEWEVSGKLSIEDLGFFHNGLDSKQHNNYISGAFEPEIYREWDNGKQSFTFVPFYRYSQHDNKRTHFDIRELTWMLAEDNWELSVGFRKVFWGVAEGLHLVDIINQTDLVENTDTEDKLGQPMINLALIREWGTIDLFVLPGFRERTFPGEEGRLRSTPEVSVGNATYEKHGIEKHLAFAIRWSHAIGDWDIGLSHFYGTSREPRLNLRVSPTGSIQLIPYYEIINQTGLDIQLTHEDWLVKHEAIIRSGQGKKFYAATTGIEYTLFDLLSSGLDLGLVVEYMYDSRGSNNILAPFQDDFLTAFRFAFNDIQSTEILAGIFFDRTNNAKFYNIEASRRLGDSFTIELEMRVFSGAPTNDASYAIREDDHFRVELGYHF